MNKFIVVSYYTKNTSYQNSVERLRQSLDKLNINYHIQPIDNLGSWDKNTHYKASFILEMLDKYPDKNIVFIDADAIVHSYPDLFDVLDVDFAVHYFRGRQLASGTLFFKNNTISRELLKAWIERNNQDKTNLDQQNLQNIIEEVWKYKITIFDLPPEYCTIFDMRERIPRPIIEHFQLSREGRIEVNLYHREHEKYSKQWKDGYQRSACAVPLGYYIAAKAQKHWKLLDIGCGDGTTINILNRLGFCCYGTDITLNGLIGKPIYTYKNTPIPENLITEAPIWNIPCKDDEFDFTFSTDMLEHLPPELINKSIKEIYRISKLKTYHCIANFSHILSNQEMHLTIRPFEWWQKHFEALNFKKIDTRIDDRKDFMLSPLTRIGGNENGI
ncbi:MAG: methyltransferase domain-containing protein [Candidatus Omnitrophota bacterium]